MAFSIVCAKVLDEGDKRTFLRRNVIDLSEMKGFINMSRSHKENGRPRNYKYKIFFSRENHEFTMQYDSPRKIALKISAKEPFNIHILAYFLYERATTSFRVKNLTLQHVVDVCADPQEDAAFTMQMDGLLAMFRLLYDIAPVIIEKKFNMHCAVSIDRADPSDKATLSKNDAKTLARCEKVAMKRLTDFNVLARLKSGVKA